MLFHTYSSQLPIPHGGEQFQHLDESLPVTWIVFRQVNFLSPICFNVLWVWKLNHFTSVHLLFSAFFWIAMNNGYSTFSLFEAVSEKFQAVSRMTINGGDVVPCASTIYFGNRRGLFDKLEITIWNTCVSVGGTIPCAKLSILKLGPKNTGSSWNRTGQTS